ncbi:MAG TPA: hypothetical protein VK148_20340 [Xanthobacteraceae bacterium]|nr:hypothetical protein [Xanthobacteraceae bacterium]
MIDNYWREAGLVYDRIGELREDPINGRFDVRHLTAIHAYIFQDLPHHQPGIIRSDAKNWTKRRELEGRSGAHSVPYVSYRDKQYVRVDDLQVQAPCGDFDSGQRNRHGLRAFIALREIGDQFGVIEDIFERSRTLSRSASLARRSSLNV